MKKLALLVVVAMFLTACRSAPDSENPDTTSEIPATVTDKTTAAVTEETTTVTEETTTTPEPPDFVSGEAKDMFNLLIDNRPVWERERGDMNGGTLLDLDFDGAPEFLFIYGESTYSADLTVYKIGDGEMTPMFSDFLSPYKLFAPAISLYTDENGKKSWVLDVLDSNDDHSVGELLLLDFTESDVTKYAKFSEISDSDGQSNMVDGEPLEYAEWIVEYIDFTERILNPNTYYLTPPYGRWYGESWYKYPNNTLKEGDPTEAELTKLVNAYYSGDNEYLMSPFYAYGAAGKPVIYLYPTEPIDVSVKVAFPKGGGFTCAYPDYNNGWDVIAYPDGGIINKADGYEYSYLYWEGEGGFDWDFSKGFVVAGENTAAFLREKLAYMGLTPREYNEFIVYWLPLMQNNAYNLVAFQTAAYTESAVLQVSPKPDSILRVFMAYKPLDKAIDIHEQELTRFERVGFSVVEWGGTAVN